MAFKVLLWIASKLEENREDEPFDTIASPVAVAGSLLLENHEGETLDGDIDIHHHPLCNPFDVMVRAGDQNLLKVLLSVGNKSVQEKLLKAIFQFGAEENALLFLEKISSDKSQCGFGINDLSPCFYLGWDKAAKSALEILAHDQRWDDLASKSVYHQLLNGFFIQKEIMKMKRNPAKIDIEVQVHRFEQIQKGNFEEIFATLDRMKIFHFAIQLTKLEHSIYLFCYYALLSVA